MWQLRLILKSLEGSTIEVSTEYSSLSGILIEVEEDYFVLRTAAHLLYVPLTSIKSLAY
ncbi:DUF2642 domain-containing protein [Ureibacillus aquaedulcis]|uniref:DUF2642 domain-containing protein n=1 Tax=Ureibacillus aquaedulcis TaxID=3058421 RepID=A0ABT8GP48_9BACL|nr:DUF2642 domain-containing protein [Ureibacillus sp. BA0131]MDN4493192.1 DUF2642 domain-containing protein [Ureibacillus sp. BA0131]